MAELIVRRVIVCLGLLVAAVILFAIGANVLLNLSVTGAHDAGAVATVWLDKNGDGRRDANEPPMEGVCAWADTTPRAFGDQQISRMCGGPDPNWHTDSSGQWPPRSSSGGINFFAGATCDDVYIYIKPPENYQATTPLIVNGCEAQFGIAPVGASTPTANARYEDYTQPLEAKQQTRQFIAALPIIIVIIGVIVLAVLASVKLVRPQEKRN